MIPLCILAIENDSDRDFMTELYLQYQRLIYDEVFRLTKDTWATEDILQLTVERLIDKIALLRTLKRNQLVNYIITSAKHNTYNYFRSQKDKRTFQFDEFWDSPTDEDQILSVEESIDLAMNLQRLAAIWPQLDDHSKYLLEGRYILDKSYEELAQQLNIKPASVRMALTRARKKAYDLLMAEQATDGFPI